MGRECQNCIQNSTQRDKEIEYVKKRERGENEEDEYMISANSIC